MPEKARLSVKKKKKKLKSVFLLIMDISIY